MVTLITVLAALVAWRMPSVNKGGSVGQELGMVHTFKIVPCKALGSGTVSSVGVVDAVGIARSSSVRRAILLPETVLGAS